MSALRNACAVLRLLSAEDPVLSVTAVAEALDLPKSTASRLLNMMADEGLLERVPRARTFRVGPLCLAAGHSFRGSSTLLNDVDILAASLVEAFGHTGYVSVRDGRDVLAVRMHPGRHALRVMTPIGQRLAAHATATGRCLLARAAAGEIASLYASGFPATPPRAPRNLKELEARIARIGRLGWEEASDEANPGVGSVAVALADPVTGEVASACISYSLASTDATERGAIRTRLLAEATLLGRRFGDPFWLNRAA